MSPNEILPAITGAGGALIVLACWVSILLSGKQVSKAVMDAAIALLKSAVDERDKQITFWQQAHAAERARADAAVLAAQTTNNVLTALHREAGT